MNLELIGRIWYATLLVPKDVREALGRVRYRQSLGTSSRKEATRLAAPLIGQWEAQIKQARGSTDAVTHEALRWKKALSQAPDEDTRESWEHALTDKLEGIEEAHGFPAAKEFSDLAAGITTPSSQYFDAWKDQIKLEAKTKDQMVKDVSLLVAKFQALEGISKNSVRHWLDGLSAKGSGHSSLKRILSSCRNYWKYLQRYDAVSRDSAPFASVLEAAPKRGGKKVTNFPYDPADVVKLWEAARKKPIRGVKGSLVDTQLADLIKVGAYTGARIEELCSLKVAKVTGNSLKIEDAKTLAGWREVPIHSAIAPLVDDLKKASKDGYLFSCLTFNKYGDRSNAIGKRFGRLKTALGFPSTHTFHSFRSTVSTLLENAEVPEGVAADIIGHDKDTMTYGLYSGGASLETKRAALEKVRYPFPKGALK